MTLPAWVTAMTTQQWLAVLGAGAGSLGSILTAFSLNWVVKELNIARMGIETTLEALVAPHKPGIPMFQGFDRRFGRASRWGNLFLVIGVLCLIAGFVLQATSVLIGP